MITHAEDLVRREAARPEKFYLVVGKMICHL
jgi:hypothetical protein